MLAAIAETVTYLPPPEAPLAIVVSEMVQDELILQRSQRFMKSVGSAALDNQVMVERLSSPEEPSLNLQESIERAAQGDPVALRMLSTNVITDVVERTVKAGHILEVAIESTDDGLIQHGQKLESVYANTLQYAANTPAMRQRAEGETNNFFRIDQLSRQGLLDDNYFVVMSRYPSANTMNDEEASEAGFFADTKSTAIQVTSAQDQALSTESAFVAGIKEPNGERHDEVAINAMAELFGADFNGLSDAEVIDTPLLIPKHLMPNGVVDLVRLYDEIVGDVFFGQAKPGQDYLDFKRQCEQRETDLQPIVNKIVGQLIARSAEIKTPIEAIQLLDKLSEESMVVCSVDDRTINPLVFGPVAAEHIEEARRLTDLGMKQQASSSIGSALKTAQSSSCPNALKKSADELPGEEKLPTDDIDDSESKTGKTRCIKCREVVDKKDVVKEDSWCCPKCKHEVDICTGKVINEGETKKPKVQKPKRREDSTIQAA